MKSGPTLADATRWPACRSATSRPVATVVLPTPECVPATTTRGPSCATLRSCHPACGKQLLSRSEVSSMIDRMADGVVVLEDAEAVQALTHPLRLAVLEALRQPDSAAGVARRI